MPRFSYKAKKGVDQTVEGIIDADDQDDAINKLAIKQLFPFSIKEVSVEVRTLQPGGGSKPFKAKISLKLGNKITSKDMLAFTQKLTTLVRARIELLSSLKILYDQTENQKLKDIILQLYNLTKEGKPFSESLRSFPKVFSPLFINLIAAGEASGHLDNSLEQVSDFMYQEESLKNRVLIALSYPALLLMVGLASIFVLINFVVPRLSPIFKGLGKNLPPITKIVLGISNVSKEVWIWAIAALVIVIVVAKYQKDNVLFKKISRFLKTSIPIVKSIRQNQELTHFARSLSLLLNGGVAALKALELASPTIDDPVLRRELQEACNKVAAGERVSKALEDSTHLPGFFIKMVAVGEESGRLSEILDGIAKSYLQQIESDIGLLSSLLEPVLILGLGVILGTIVLAVLLPTFQVTQMVH